LVIAAPHGSWRAAAIPAKAEALTSGEGVGGLLTTKSGGWDLDAGAGIVLGTNNDSDIFLCTISNDPARHGHL
jgi:hypothetical protein